MAEPATELYYSGGENPSEIKRRLEQSVNKDAGEDTELWLCEAAVITDQLYCDDRKFNSSSSGPNCRRKPIH